MKTKKMIKTSGLTVLMFAVAAMVVAGCGEDEVPEDFTAVSAAPEVTVVDSDGDGQDVGDYSVFEAPVTKDGKRFGDLYGLKLTVAAPPVDGAPSADLGLFQNQLTFVFPDGDVIIGGTQFYTLDGSIPDSSEKSGEYRAILGGTGAYAGARGVLHTTARPDGTRQQEFDFLD